MRQEVVEHGEGGTRRGEEYVTWVEVEVVWIARGGDLEIAVLE